MSWLYSIVFAGLLFSSGHEQPAARTQEDPNVGTTVESVQADETEKFEQTYPLSPNGRVRASNINGSIIVEAWDRSEVKLEATKVADSKETLAEVEIKIESRPDSFSVESDYGNWKQKNGGGWDGRRKLQVHYHLWVPRGATLNEIETVNGSVTVSNFVNFTKISAVNGSVKATNLRGTANLSTVNGEVAADFDGLEAGSKISLSTVNGRVNLSIPSDSNATLKADSLNGNISNEFGLPVRKGQYVGRDLYGRIGNGDVQIKLSSVNGPLSVTRKKDGRNPSPATDLLPQKGQGETDIDVDAAVDTQKVNREIARATRDAARASRAANKEMAAALRDAQKELAKVDPVIRINAEELKKAAVVINSAEIQAKVREGIQVQMAELARLREINFSGAMPRIEKKSKSFTVKDTPTVTIDAKGCAVKVRGWDKQEVSYVVTEFSTGARRQPVTVGESQNGDNVNIKVVSSDSEAVNGDFFDDVNRVRVEVYVPRRSNLKIMTNGEIRLDGVSGEIDLSGADESINIRNSDGKLTVANADGRVRVIGFRGDLDARTVDGEVYLEGDFRNLSARAEDGTFTLTLPAGSNAAISSTTEIETEGFNLVKDRENLWRLGSGGSARYKFEFAGGKLVLRNSSQIAAY